MISPLNQSMLLTRWQFGVHRPVNQPPSFRYYDKSNGADLELGFIDDKKIQSQSVVELKAVIRGWMCSEKFVGARRENGFAVLFESNSPVDPAGLDYVEPGKDGVANLQGFVI